jgi:hypothetical protein
MHETPVNIGLARAVRPVRPKSASGGKVLTGGELMVDPQLSAAFRSFPTLKP